MPFAVDVLFPLPLGSFRYLVTPGEKPGPVGGRVVAPWQGGVRIGLAIAVEELPARQAGEYREVLGWLDREPFLAQGSTELIPELSQASGAPEGTVLASLVPVGLHDELVHELALVEGAESISLRAGEWLPAHDLGTGELELYRSQGMVRERFRPAERTVSRLVPLRASDDALAGAPQANQLQALRRLEEVESAASAAELAREADVPESAARALVRKGYAGYRDQPAPPTPLKAPEPADPAMEPKGRGPGNSPVTLVSGGLRRDRLAAVLPALERDLAAGRGVLVLVPEVAFLAEAASLLASRLPVLTLSGEATDEQRRRIWDEVASGRPLVLVATYAGLLAPFPSLARIVILEAGSGSYKLPAGPRLFVPAAARRLADLAEVPLVLTDALASPEMRLWAKGTPAVGLPRSAQRLFVSDLGEGSGWPLGTDLVRVLRQVRERERQAVLLAPRRGFSAALTCEQCSHIVMCPHCDLALRYHRSQARLRCHQCGHAQELPEYCPECGAGFMAPGRAAGTEWVGNAVQRLLPDVEVARFDRDRQDDLERLREGATGVLIATTAAFRIPPLPNVSLVGVTLFDTHVNVSDFRAAEEGMRLLLQLPELAPGRRPLVVVQTFQPEHPALLALGSDDPDSQVESYLNDLFERRERFGYPPFGNLAKIQVSARDRSAAEREAVRLAGSLRTAGAGDDEVLGPVPAPIARLRGHYSFQVYLRGADDGRFNDLLAGVSSSVSSVRVRVDVDPRHVAEFLE